MYTFCPKCAGRLKMQTYDGSLRPICQRCGFIFYQNSKPTSSALIVNKENEVLLLKRAIHPHFGKWDIPGGFLQNGEDPIVGLKREIREELKIGISGIAPLIICTDKYGLKTDDFYTLNIFFRCEIKKGEIKLSSENSKFQWLAESYIPWKELAFDNTTIALKALFKVK